MISQATATSDIVSMRMDFDNDQSGNNCISWWNHTAKLDKTVHNKIVTDWTKHTKPFKGTDYAKKKKKTPEVLRPFHCGMKKILAQPDKPFLDGMWTTLITLPPKTVAEYIRMSKTCTESIIPQIVQTNIHEYENSLRNKVRSMRVLY